MSTKISFLPVILCACGAPIIDESISADMAEEELNSPEEQGEETTEEDQTEEESEEEPSQEEFSGTLQSGVWSAANPVLVEDTCDWDSMLRQFFGVGSDALLPKDFTVESFDGYFEIEANSYGASGPIVCGIEDSAFTCETQSVTPIDFDLGTYGWTYAIDFSGVINSDRSLNGTAVVRFPTVSDFLVPVFESGGVDVSQCTQTYEFSIINDL